MATHRTSSATQLPLHDRVAIITGGSRGIGKGIALHLASLGAKVVINYSASSSTKLAEELVSHINWTYYSSSGYSNHQPSSPPPPPHRAIAFRADVSDPDQVKALFDAAEEAFEAQPHILVTSAAINDPKYPKIAELSVEDFDKTMAVNARGTFLCIREAANRVKRGGGGRIITITSSMTEAPMTGYGAYTASKAAVQAMVKTLAKELRGTGITANSIAPGPVATDLFYDGKDEETVRMLTNLAPLGRLGETQDIATVVGFVAGDAGEWINGQVILVNGGYV
ncbi:hypothetical protein Dimus_001782 [Dionaea muscipula]